MSETEDPPASALWSSSAQQVSAGEEQDALSQELATEERMGFATWGPRSSHIEGQKYHTQSHGLRDKYKMRKG